ncbi:thermonuclease family protein [Xanthobacter sp. DSM 24535]|uniref:thermonuclease family protein n=1 Tax=Roseixanthobacter psychrophilus TaxID=3119917 RepID=UPI0037294CCE
MRRAVLPVMMALLSGAAANAAGCPKLKAVSLPEVGTSPSLGRQSQAMRSQAIQSEAGTAGITNTDSQPGDRAPAGHLQVVTGIADGAILLSGGERLVPRGAVIPTRLNPAAELTERAEAAARALLLGRTLRFAQGERDRHGRHVADAFVQGESETLPLSLLLLQAGAAYADPAAVPACTEELRAAELRARQSRAGLWSSASAVLSAGDASAVAARIGLFTLVEGRVRAANLVLGLLYLNFGSRWRDDVTVTLSASRAARIPSGGLAPAILAGTFVRVRGVVNEQGGPLLALASTAALDFGEQRQ